MHDREVRKGALRIAWFLADMPSFGGEGCRLGDAEIAAETGLAPHTVANGMSQLRALGHVVCRWTTVAGGRERTVRPAYLLGGSGPGGAGGLILGYPGPLPADAPTAGEVASELDLTACKPVEAGPAAPALPPACEPEPDTPSSPQPIVPDRVFVSADVADDYPVQPPSVSCPSWQPGSDIDQGWSVKRRDIPARCQHAACEAPAAFLCLQTEAGYCRRHQRHAALPIPLAFSELTEW